MSSWSWFFYEGRARRWVQLRRAQPLDVSGTLSRVEPQWEVTPRRTLDSLIFGDLSKDAFCVFDCV